MRPFQKILSCGILALCGGSLANAQMGTPSNDGFAITASAYQMLDSGLDTGEDWSTSSLRVKLGKQWRMENGNRIGLDIAYAYQDHDFSGGWQPWQSVKVPEVSVSWMQRLNDEWSLFIAPSLQLSMEDGADSGDALRLGTLVAFNRFYSRNLQIGFGAGAYTGLEDSKAFPLLMIRWQINEQWYVGNPFAPGPMGPAGLELGFRSSENWTLAVGGSYRSNRFALDEQGPSGNGYGETEGVALFVRSTHTFKDAGELHLYAGTLVGGELSVDDPAGATLVKTDFDPSLLIAIAWQARF